MMDDVRDWLGLTLVPGVPLLGQTITVNQSAMTIVGVNPRGFTGANGNQNSPDLFIPLSMQPVVTLFLKPH